MSNVFWIQGDPAPSLAIVLRPRGDDLLEIDMAGMKRDGVQILVSLLEKSETEMLGLEEEGSFAERTGMEFLSYPIPDVHVPQNPVSFRAFAESLATQLRSGKRVGIHCRGSIGRATVTAACSLIHLGWNARIALAAIERARGCPVPDTHEQYKWILKYKVQP